MEQSRSRVLRGSRAARKATRERGLSAQVHLTFPAAALVAGFDEAELLTENFFRVNLLSGSLNICLTITIVLPAGGGRCEEGARQRKTHAAPGGGTSRGSSKVGVRDTRVIFRAGGGIRRINVLNIL